MCRFPDKTDALVVVDVQRDFTSPDGSPDGSLYVPGGEQVVAVANLLSYAAEKKGVPMVFTHDGDSWADGLYVPTTAIVTSDGDDAVVQALKAAGVERVVVVGLPTEYSVKGTVLALLAADLRVTVIHEGIRAANLEPDDGKNARREMREHGAEIVRLLDAV